MFETKQKLSKTALISFGVCLAIAVALASILLPKYIETLRAEDEYRQWKERVLAQAAEYTAGVPFTLHGDGEAADDDLASVWDWDGDLQFEYSNVQAFATLEEAGFTVEESPWSSEEFQDQVTGYVVVDLDLTNIDAHVRDYVIDYLGGEAITANLFSLSDDGSNRHTDELAAISGPRANVPNLESGKAEGYIWAEPGSTAHYRIAFECYDHPVPEHPRLLLNIGGDYFGLVTIDLGELPAS